jgi:hypothetical protein
MGRWWVALVVVAMPSVAVADRYDDAVARTDKAFDSYKVVETRYAALYAKWEQLYKPIDVQYPVVVEARRKADAACAKDKRTKNCHDLTLAYAAEHKKYDALVWDKDSADPKREYAPVALNLVATSMQQKREVFETSKAATIKLFDEAYQKARSKAERDQLDAKLAVREGKRNDKFEAGRSAAADAKNPRSSGSSSSSSSGGSGTRAPSVDAEKIIRDTEKRW